MTQVLDDERLVANLGLLVKVACDLTDLPLATYADSAAALRGIANPEASHISFFGEPTAQRFINTGAFSDVACDRLTMSREQKLCVRSGLADADDLLRRSHDQLAHLVNSIITDILVVTGPGAGGCSVSSMPGVVVVNPARTWAAENYAYCLVHESTHLSIFLEDMLHGVFDHEAIHGDANNALAPSAVRVGEVRPYEAAFHAAVVAATLLDLERSLGGSAMRLAHGRPLQLSATALRDKAEYLLPAGRAMLNRLVDFAGDLT